MQRKTKITIDLIGVLALILVAWAVLNVLMGNLERATTLGVIAIAAGLLTD